MLFRQIPDEKLAQYAYLIGCQATGEALIVDPERDVDRYLALAHAEGLRIVAVAETHIHADFLSGAREMAEHDPEIRLYLSDEGDADWKYLWARDERYRTQFVRDGDRFRIGKIEITVQHTPGHTPEHISFLVTDLGGGATQPMGLLSGDFVFVGDLGRPDLLETAAGVSGAQEPSARRLYQSARGFLDLPDHLQIWPAHGAGSACGKALGAVPQTTVGYERRFSPAIAATEHSEQAFVDFILSGQPEPPLYFARMKQLNKSGATVLGELPHPRRLDAEAFEAATAEHDSVVLDTRRDRTAFMARHLRGAIHAPLDRSFPTIAGSFVQPHEWVLLIAEPQQVEEAVRALVRIGIDRIDGYVDPVEIGAMDRIAATAVADEHMPHEGFLLDVRTRAEFEVGHVDGAVNIAHTRLASRLDELPRDQPIFVYCKSGARAGASTSLLEREGFDVTLIDAPFVVEAHA